MPRFTWLRGLAELPAAAYETLRQSIADATPFNHLAWLRGAESALTPAQSLHILLAWAGEPTAPNQRLLLCLPLIYCQERLLGVPLHVVRHLGYPLSDRLTLLVDTNAAHVLMPAALREIRRRLPHALIQFGEITAVAAHRAGLALWARDTWRWHSRISCRTPEHRLHVGAHADVPDTDALRHKLRQKLRKARKDCAAIGAQVQRLCPNAHNIDALLASIEQVEQSSWKGEQGVGIFSGARRRTWMYTALRALAADARLRLVLLMHEQRCVSYRLGLFENGRLYDYNIAFLADYAHLNSGRLLLDEWIAWGLDEGWQWIDASRVSLHQSTHQLHERMTGQVEHCHWRFYSRRPSGLALGLSDWLWQRIKARRPSFLADQP